VKFSLFSLNFAVFLSNGIVFFSEDYTRHGKIFLKLCYSVDHARSKFFKVQSESSTMQNRERKNQAAQYNLNRSIKYSIDII
jgi:hypothetical protein